MDLKNIYVWIYLEDGSTVKSSMQANLDECIEIQIFDKFAKWGDKIMDFKWVKVEYKGDKDGE